MLNATLGVKLYAHCYTRSEAICSLPYIECSIVLISINRVKLYAHSIQGVKLCAHCYTWSEVICSLLWMK